MKLEGRVAVVSGGSRGVGSASIDPGRLDSLRRRSSLLLLAGVSIGSTALIISITVTALVAENITGNATLSGVPIAASVFGTAAGTSLLSLAMARWGRRRGLISFYAIGAIGAFGACVATVERSFPLLVGSLFVMGIGNSANALTRYVAAELQSPERRARMVGWIVWAGTIGAVVGPNLLSPADRVGVSLGLPELAGAYVVAVLAFVLASALYIVLLRPDPSLLSVPSDEESPGPGEAEGGIGRLLRLPRVQVSVIALVFGHVVMVLIMTMTPLFLKAAGHSLGVIGVVMSSHIVGMFLFAPITGILVDRLGAVRIIFAGQALLLLSALGGTIVPASSSLLVATVLFLLGLGWNLGFVAGSASLTRGIPAHDRPLLQGRADSIVWVSAATASLLSSVLFSTIGFAGLSAVGAVAILVAATTIAIRRRAIPPAAEAV